MPSFRLSAVADQSKLLTFLRERTEGQIIALTYLQAAIKRFHCSFPDMETLALRNSILPSRFQRNGFSCSEQLKLLQASVAVIGCGGLGGRTAEILARTGIGTLILTDPDTFNESNLNRQIFSSIETLGCFKTEIISRELKKINPALTTIVHSNPFNDESVNKADIVIDGLDSPEARRGLAKLCRQKNIPLIHGAAKEWYGQVGIEQTDNGLINALYPHTAKHEFSPNVQAATVALIASHQAAETCKLLLTKGSSLEKAWLQCDLLHCDHEKIKTDTCL